jgi:hypothetical protein
VNKRIKKSIPGNSDIYPVGTLVVVQPSAFVKDCFNIHAAGKPIVTAVPKDYLEDFYDTLYLFRGWAPYLGRICSFHPIRSNAALLASFRHERLERYFHH